MPFYASAEQVMRDKTEFARKGIARGRSVAVLSYGGGVLLVAETSSTLHKVAEIYDRIGFAAVGRYNEFENLRQAGIRYADTRGYSYDRRDVTGRGLANAFAQTLGTIFSEQLKPFEVELCVAEVGATSDRDELYRLTFDGSVVDEPDFVVMGGQADVVTTALRAGYRRDMELAEAIGVTVRALGAVGAENGAPRELAANQLEVAILDRTRAARSFRRITGAALEALLPGAAAGEPPVSDTAGDTAGGDGKPDKPGASGRDLLREPVAADHVEDPADTPEDTPGATQHEDPGPA